MAKRKNLRGRPTTLTPELIEKARQYAMGDWRHSDHVENVMVPSLAGLACYLLQSKPTVQTWATNNAEFAYIYDAIQAMQHHILENGGLSNQMNSAMCKLLLSQHGVIERRELDVKDTRALSELSDAELEKIAGAK